MAKRRVSISGVFSSASVPPAHALHPLVAKRFFFTIPLELLDEVTLRVGKSAFDTTLLNIEYALSRICGDHSTQIGFRDGAPVLYDLLADPLSLNVAALEAASTDPALAWLPSRIGHLLDVLGRRSSWIRHICQGYSGWLAQNRTFMAEQEVMFRQQLKAIRTYGLPRTGAVLGSKRYVVAVGEFCLRWHLQGLGGPFLPSPFRPLVPVPHELKLTRKLASVGTTVFFPAIFPLPDRKELRQMIEDAMGRHDPPSHLRPWIELVESDAQGKRAIDRHARIFKLQHYWRVLFSRHANVLKGNIAKVREAFAAFLFPNAGSHALPKHSETIRKDLAQLAKARGGARWFLNSSIYDHL